MKWKELTDGPTEGRAELSQQILIRMPQGPEAISVKHQSGRDDLVYIQYFCPSFSLGTQNVTTNRPSPANEEREQLRQFVRIVDSMSRRRFMERFREQDHSLSFVGGDVSGPNYDREDFEAFLTDFRKVAMSDNEP